MEEIWKDIPEYEGFYQVSNLGRVKSVKRKIKIRAGVYVTLKELFLKPSVDGGGYYQVILNKKSKRKTIKVHKLVSMAFLNHKPCGYKLVVNHIDFNKLNNRLDNLEIVTQRENANLKHIKSTSKYVGVCWNKFRNKWVSYIKINGKLKYLGLFKCELQAHQAYQKALNNIIKL